MLTPHSVSQSRITRNDPVVVLNVRISLCRPRRAPGVRTHTVTESLPTSRPATRSNNTSISDSFRSAAAAIAAAVARKVLCQDTDPRARSNSPEAPEDPASYTSTGSPAPVCPDVAGRPPILIRQCSDRRSQNGYTSCITGALPPCTREANTVRPGMCSIVSTREGLGCLPGCDVDAQADRRGWVFLPDPPGRRVGCDRPRAHRLGGLLHPAWESPGVWLGSALADVDLQPG